jgi:hypothetical protein
MHAGSMNLYFSHLNLLHWLKNFNTKMVESMVERHIKIKYEFGPCLYSFVAYSNIDSVNALYILIVRRTYESWRNVFRETFFAVVLKLSADEKFIKTRKTLRIFCYFAGCL